MATDQQANYLIDGPNGGSFPEIRWQSLALCHGLTSLFFAKGRSDIAQYDQERAKGLCKHCDVRTQCFHAAFSGEEPEYGIWGGFTEDERRALDHSVKKAVAALGVTSGSEDWPVLRRRFLSLFGAVLLDTEDLARILSGPTVDAKTLDSLERATIQAYASYGTLPARRLLTVTQTQLQLVTGLLGNAQRSTHKTRLLAIGGRLSTLMGALGVDLDDPGGPAWYRAASHFGREAGDLALSSHVLGNLAYDAMYFGNPNEVLRLTEAAEAMAGGSVTAKSSASHLAWYFLLQAWAQAAMGRGYECLRAQDRAEQAFVQTTPCPWRLGEADEAKQAGNRGRCLLLLDMPEVAEPVLREALALRGPERVVSRSLLSLDLATALMNQGYLEEACRVAGDAITISPDYRVASIVRSAQEFRARLQPRSTHPAVREFEERLRGMGGVASRGR
jgi:hypothetical protein